MSRLYVIADIHGRLDLLDALLAKMASEESVDFNVDKLVFTGDYIDRGPDSKGVINRVRNLTLLHPQNVIALAGNHEWLAIDAHIKPDYDTKHLWHVNGGDKTLMSYGDPTSTVPYSSGHQPALAMPEADIRWLAFLPLFHQEPGFFFSHAPVPRDSYRRAIYKGQATFEPEELIWTYDPDEKGVARDHGNGIIGVCGHIHALRKGVLAPRFYDHYIFADSGCGCSKKAPLCAIEVRSRKVVYVYPTV